MQSETVGEPIFQPNVTLLLFLHCNRFGAKVGLDLEPKKWANMKTVVDFVIWKKIEKEAH